MRKHINSLDGVRGVALLFVFLFHQLARTGYSHFFRVASFGWAGVDAFFVLSGFLITGILFNKRGRPHFFRNFYMRRGLRLFPLYYFIFLVILVLTPFLHIHWRLGHLPFLFYGANMAIIHDPSVSALGPFTLRHLWSLGVEEQFYFIWPWIVGSRLSRQALIKFCISGIVGAFLLRLILVHFDVSGWFLYESLPTRMDALLVGALIALIQLPSVRTAAIAAAAALGVYVVVVWLGHTMFYGSLPMMTFGYTSLAFLFGAILVLSLHPATVVSRFFSSSVLRFFGKYSYGLYLWHYILADRFDEVFNRFVPRIGHDNLSLLLYCATALGFYVLVSMASFRYLETPFLNLKRYFKH
jgi:peptidoglycan/LPS O-acetylase OafA/YrhL